MSNIIKKFREKVPYITNSRGHFYDGEKAEQFLQQQEQEIRNEICEKVEKLRKKMTTIQIGCPDNMPGCLVYHSRTAYTKEDESFNQELEEVLKIIKSQE
jgi:hypothetical protein